MAEVLSQKQIDALLKGIDSGEIEETPTLSATDNRKVKEYDFRSPKKFTKEQLRLIDNLHENLGRQLSSYFSSILRIFCEVKVLQVEEQRYYEFNNALPDNTLIGIVELKPENENLDEMTTMMEFSSGVTYSVIDRLLGGVGGGGIEDRDFTEIELNIMRNVMSKMTFHIQEAWGTLLPTTARVASIETNPRLLQLFSPEDIVVIVLLELKVGTAASNISICLPAAALGEMMGEFVPKYMRSGTKSKIVEEREINRKENIEHVLNSASIDIHVIFDTIELELADVLRLQPDDVIKLKKPLNGDVDIIIDNKPYFQGTLGLSKDQKAVRINKVYQ